MATRDPLSFGPYLLDTRERRLTRAASTYGSPRAILDPTADGYPL